MKSNVNSLMLAAAALAAAPVAASYTNSNSSSPCTGSPDPFQKYTLTADGINATFIPYGARLTSLFVNDKNGHPQDVAIGYDDPKQYVKDTETIHTYFGAVVGRYANRIKNGTFTLDGVTSHIPENENGGKDTLHGGGAGGYDVQNWTVTAHTTDSITFTLYDPGLSNFPGAVLNVATYTLVPGPAWISRLVSIPIDRPTPIMLANHIYWNLGAFTTAPTILNDTLTMPYADRYIGTDGILIPTGAIDITANTPLDFTTGKTIGRDILNATNVCGTGCTGYDTAFITDRPPTAALRDPSLEVLKLYAPSTGIQMTLETDQQGLQIYSCNGLNGTVPVKASQQHGGNKTTYVEKYGCLVVEAQDWIDGINHPEWARDRFQVFSPRTEPYVNYQKYSFSVVK